MTTIRYSAIRCDGCGSEGPIVRASWRDDPGAVGARRDLRKRGWRRVPGSRWSGRDYCKTCTTQHPEAK